MSDLNDLFDKLDELLELNMTNKGENQMAKTLDQAGNEVHVAQVIHHGEQITIPEGMTIPKAIEVLKARDEYLRTEMAFTQEFDVFPWEGAYALMKALQRRYGWAQAVPTPGFWGPSPPVMISIEVGPNQKVDVPWGRFVVPGISKGWLATDTCVIKGRVSFSLQARILRNDEYVVKGIAADMSKILAEESMYRGQAIKVKFNNDDGEALKIPELSFIDTASIQPEQLILSDEVLDSVTTNLFTPITRVRELVKNGITIKRGILLGGIYGTGKTLAASVASRLAVEAGVTFLYVGHASELSAAVLFAQRYNDPACVVFCEDIDRETDGERDVEMDELLNIIDGLDTKRSNMIVVLTTNNIEAIHPAMLRPGRLDAVIDVTPPDAKAVEALLRFYGGNKIAKTTDLVEVGTVLAGSIPAVIAEVVKRAKLAELKRSKVGSELKQISATALLESAKTMQNQLKLLYKDRNPPKEQSFKALVVEAVHESFSGNGAGNGELRKELGKYIATQVAAKVG